MCNPLEISLRLVIFRAVVFSDEEGTGGCHLAACCNASHRQETTASVLRKTGKGIYLQPLCATYLIVVLLLPSVFRGGAARSKNAEVRI